ncbi:copper resistance CopC/CopD family protein [Natronorubrum tibetense]|uniref:Copper resistance protein CopC n=1 Tax=Natronorubrum tibetense GA33 TaxID=1114856 RepID=L9VSC3_9EURY|nr:copper resistance protein CopC [Natronorubrum tibetense]ELY40044.1 copper resistance protein CopC [Natronorubrum tibetense GA33]
MDITSSIDGGGPLSRTSLFASVLVALVVMALAIGLVATPVAAHAYLSETDPGNGEQIDSLPDEVTLYFSGDGVVNADITVVDPDDEVVSEESEIDSDDTQVVDVPIDEDATGDEGMYTVEWEVLADDGHTTSGSFFFAVGDEPLDRDAVLEAYEESEGDEDESIPPFEAGAKALLLVGVAGLIGIPAIATVAVGPAFARADASQRERIGGQLTALLAGAAGLAALGALALGLARSAAMGPLSIETITQFTETPLGQAWLVQVALAVGVAGFVAALARGRLPRRGALAGTFVGALAVAGTIAWTSHSATAIDRLNGAIVDFVHIVGAGLWVGGLAVLAFVVVPTVRNAHPDDRPVLLAATIRRFSILALVGVTFVVGTGFVLASWHVPTASGLTDTVYGLVLAAKLILVVAGLALGGLTRYVLLGRLESAPPTDAVDGSRPTSTDGGSDGSGRQLTITRIARAVRLEVTLLVVVLLLSGLLTSAPTAAVAGMDGDEPIEATIEYEYDDGVVEVTALPVVNESTNESFELRTDEPIVFEVAFLENDSPVDSERPVRLLASGGDGTEIEVELEETDDGTYATVQPLPDAGEWELRVTGAPGGSYVSEWIDATALPADEHAEHDDGAEEHDHADHDHGADGHDHGPDDHDHGADDHDHGADDHDHGADGHDHGPDGHDAADEASPFQTLLEFGAVATVVAGSLAVAVEGLQRRSRND